MKTGNDFTRQGPAYGGLDFPLAQQGIAMNPRPSGQADDCDSRRSTSALVYRRLGHAQGDDTIVESRANHFALL